MRGSGDAQALNPDELQLLRFFVLSVPPEEDGLLHPFHEFILGARLRVAARKSRNSSHQDAVGIPLDDDVVVPGHSWVAGFLQRP